MVPSAVRGAGEKRPPACLGPAPPLEGPGKSGKEGDTLSGDLDWQMEKAQTTLNKQSPQTKPKILNKTPKYCARVATNVR